MTLEEIFKKRSSENYLMSYLNGDFHDEFIVKRSISATISDHEIPFILDLLADDNKKWFVASYLRTVESFNENLFKRIIEVGVDTFDPSYNRFFIQPGLRVFGCIKVIEVLEDILKNNPEKDNDILSAVYHVGSLINVIGEINAYKKWEWIEVGLKYKWNPKDERYEAYHRNENCRMTPEEVEHYRPMHNEFLRRKRDLILKIKDETKNPSVAESANRMLSL